MFSILMYFYDKCLKILEVIFFTEYEMILNNHHEEIFYDKFIDTDDIIILTDSILYFFYINECHNDTFMNIIKNLTYKIKTMEY